MRMKALISLRKCNTQFYNTVMYEWEDDIQKKGIKIILRNKYTKLFWLFILYLKKDRPMIRQFSCVKKRAQNKLAFLMFVPQYSQFYPERIIPIFVDTRDNTFSLLIESIKNINTAIITNRSALERAKKIYPEKHLYSIPLWCSDKWALSTPPSKSIDVLQIGRKNNKLHSWMLEYAMSHQKVEYIYKDDLSNNYISTKRGDIGPLDSRDGYMRMLRAAKVCLVSSPLVDSEMELDFITPRVYEAAMSYCYMLGRFTINAEFKEIGLNRVVDLIDSYNLFETRLTEYLQTNEFVKLKEYNEFIGDNSFKNRWKLLSQMLEC